MYYNIGVYKQSVFCLYCLPVDKESEHFHPYFSTDEVDSYPVCDSCGVEETYMSLTTEGINHIICSTLRKAKVILTSEQIDNKYGDTFYGYYSDFNSNIYFNTSIKTAKFSEFLEYNSFEVFNIDNDKLGEVSKFISYCDAPKEVQERINQMDKYKVSRLF